MWSCSYEKHRCPKENVRFLIEKFDFPKEKSSFLYSVHLQDRLRWVLEKPMFGHVRTMSGPCSGPSWESCDIFVCLRALWEFWVSVSRFVKYIMVMEALLADYWGGVVVRVRSLIQRTLCTSVLTLRMKRCLHISLMCSRCRNTLHEEST